MKALLALAALLSVSPAFGATALQALDKTLAKDPALSPRERAALMGALTKSFGKTGKGRASDAAVKAAADAVVEGTFDEQPADRIAEVAFSAYHAVQKGASGEAAQGVALYGYRKKVPASTIADWAGSYTQMLAKDVEPSVAADLVRVGFERGLAGKGFAALKGDLIRAAGRGLDQRAYASFLFDGLARGEAPVKIVAEARRRFTTNAAKAAADALLKGPPKSGADLLGKIVKGSAGAAKHAARKTAPKPKPQAPQTDIPPGTQMAKLWPDLHGTAESYLGTPYVWGGTTHKGIDCSGFTQATFGENKVKIPRVSQDQWKTGTPVEMNDLRRGDLIFFDTLGHGVSHVALVIDTSGGATFMHASSSKGVSIAELSKKWFKTRYLGARRVVP